MKDARIKELEALVDHLKNGTSYRILELESQLQSANAKLDKAHSAIRSWLEYFGAVKNKEYDRHINTYETILEVKFKEALAAIDASGGKV